MNEFKNCREENKMKRDGILRYIYSHKNIEKKKKEKNFYIS